MGRPAADCLGRGLASLRANPELVLIQWLQNFAVAALAVAGALPIAGVLGFEKLLGWGRGGGVGGPDPLALLQGLEALWLPLAAALLAALALWLLAFLVYCFFQGGIFGVLVAGDRQAPGAAGDWRWFRTFTWANFTGWGRRYLWRYFWLINLYAAVALALCLVLLLAAVAAVQAARAWGAPAGIGIGCGAALPLLFAFFVTALWLGLAQADLAREGSGVGIACRRALEVLGRRLGAVLLIYLLIFALGMALGLVFAPVSLGLDLALAGRTALRAALSLALLALQWLLSAAVAVAFAGTLVALVRGEAPGAGP